MLALLFKGRVVGMFDGGLTLLKLDSCISQSLHAIPQEGISLFGLPFQSPATS